MDEKRIKGQLLKGMTPLLVLSVLKDGELYGYEIAQRIRERTDSVFALNEGALYPALHALEAEGSLSAIWRESDKGPKRRYYALTDKGRGKLVEHEREWVTFRTAVAKATG
jgi:DNA-binding PadR family transcriptional regulator